MMPVIYTTYGVAMGHRPETLAASGGLRPAGGAGSAEAYPAPVLVSRAWWWLKTLVVRVGGRHRNAAGRTEDSEETPRLFERMLPSSLTRAATTRTGGERA
jgi:hypothetical protein